MKRTHQRVRIWLLIITWYCPKPIMRSGLIFWKRMYRAGRPICRKVLKIMFWEVPLADTVATYCPGRPSQLAWKKNYKILRLIGRPAMYISPLKLRYETVAGFKKKRSNFGDEI